jgi:DtxR family Mn-dependent transcriptional regulator
MPTQTKENYLKALYHLDQKSDKISLTDLSKKMGVSAPTVNDMVKKLQKQGWVDYQKYKPLKITNEGKLVAGLIIRKHRLTEMFLTQIMSFGWEEVHDIAEEMEHLKTPKLFERMDELLGFPTEDPHGSPIPDKEGVFHSANYQRLINIEPGNSVVIKALENSSVDFLQFLNKKNIQLGTELIIHSVESFDQTYTVSYADHENISLSETVCGRLLVEEL